MARLPSGSERRLVLLVGAVVFVDTMFYAAIAPILPALAHELHLSKFSAGVMTASYPMGTLLGSVPGGLLAVRVGPRATVCTGLALLAASTAAFGVLENEVALDVARLVEGIGGACSWAGGLAWVAAQAGPEHRGEMMGGALGAAIGGALFGPVIGTIASAIGRAFAFSGVVVIALALIVAARRLQQPSSGSNQRLTEMLSAARAPRLLGAMWLVALPAIASGTMNVLGPLRLHRLGAGAAAIGATYLAATAAEAALSPVIGRLSDRRGRLLPLRAGLLSACAMLAIFTVPEQAAVLAIVLVAITLALGLFWAPAMALLSDAAEMRGLEQGFAAALINLAWAVGQTVGAGTGGAAAKAAGDAVPVVIVAAACAVTLLVLELTVRQLR